jgi:RNA polymerase primary sigma factor
MAQGKQPKPKKTRKAAIAREENLDSLEQYLGDISKLPLLSREEELHYARLAQHGDEEARTVLIERNTRFAISQAKKFQNRGIPLADLISEANLGLCKAANKFDPELGVKFISYAVWWVRQSLLQVVSQKANSIRLPTAVRSQVMQIKYGAERIQQELAIPYHDALLMYETRQKQAGTPIPEYVWQAYHTSLSMASLDAPRNKRPSGPELMERVASEQATPEEQTLQSELERIVREGISPNGTTGVWEQLPPRDRKILQLHYGINEMREHTLEEIGTMLGVTRERIRQIRDRALKRMQHTSIMQELHARYKQPPSESNSHHLPANAATQSEPELDPELQLYRRAQGAPKPNRFRNT